MRSTSLAVALCVLSTHAHAQAVTLVCAHAGQPPEATLEIDYARSVVNYPAPDTPIRVSESTIAWQTERRTDRSGVMRPPGHFLLDRLTGEFRQQYFCDGCVPIPILYCKPGAKLF